MTDIREGWTSASNAEADLLCPGRHLAQKGFPELPESEDAKAGTLIHARLAGTDVCLSPEEAEMSSRCSILRDSIVNEWERDGDDSAPYTEERLWCAVGNLKHSGQPDVVFVQGTGDSEPCRRALVLDYKTGRNEVREPNTNQQLRDLAVLASIRWPVIEVTVAIVQPFAPRNPPCVYDEKDLQRALKDMRARVRMSNNPMAPRVAGEKQCRYCKAKVKCREYSEWTRSALPMVNGVGIGIEKPWTPEQWAQFLTILPEAESWIESKRQAAKAMLKENPDAIPGYALETSQREKIVNAQAVFQESINRGVKPEDFMQAVTVTKKGLREAFRKAGKVGKELDSEIKAVCFGNTEQTETEPRLVKKPPRNAFL